jgi:hypothetical protein
MSFSSAENSKKAVRLVTGRRFGNIATNTDAFEPFVPTIDISSQEVYTQAHLIPSGSNNTATNNIPFSGSGQANYYLLSNGTIDTTSQAQVPANALLRYWYRHQLAEEVNNTGREYFFIKNFTPGESDAGRWDAKFVSANQVTNFISNKYASGSIAGNKAEAPFGSAGYEVVVSTTNAAGDATTATTVPNTDWAFDYKTGVLQFYTARTDGTKVFLTAYQYVGETLKDRLANTTTGPSGGGGSFISSSNTQTYVSASDTSVTIQVANTAVGGFTSTSASFSVPISSSFNGVGFFGTASWAVNSVTASYVTASNVYGPYGSNSIVSASFAYTASNITNAYINRAPAPIGQIVFSSGSGTVTGSSQFYVNPDANGGSGSLYVGGATLSNNALNWTANSAVFNIGLAGGGTQAVVINPTGGANGNGLITFNYSASFTAPSTFVNAINSTFANQFILLASGSGASKDSGVVFEDWSNGNTIGQGAALFYDAESTKRLAFKFTASSDATAMVPQAFVNMTFVKDPVGTAPWSYANRTDVDNIIGDKVGFMYLDDNGDIYIKSN